MNKEVIKANREAFDYWLLGGYIWAKGTLMANTWVRSKDEEHWNCKQIGDHPIFIVQDDAYSEFRKALADGKIIEVRDNNCNQYTDVFSPVLFNLPVERYRVKPDEPKFKVGDWVRHTNSNNIGMVETKPSYETFPNCENWRITVNGCCYDEESFELWKPQPGEWCVLWNDEAKSYRVGKFKMIGYGSGREGSYKDEQGNYFNNIAPLEFIQTLKDRP